MAKRRKKDFNHNLIVVGIVGVVAVIGILFTLSSGTYTGKAAGYQTKQVELFNLYDTCKDMHGHHTGCATDSNYIDKVQDWCQCRVYGHIYDVEPTVNTKYDKSELSGRSMQRECGESPSCSQNSVFKDLTGKVAGTTHQASKNKKDFITCLNKGGHVPGWERIFGDTTHVDVSKVPEELTAWCSCRFSGIIENFHANSAAAILNDNENFQHGDNDVVQECGDNPLSA